MSILFESFQAFCDFVEEETKRQKKGNVKLVDLGPEQVAAASYVVCKDKAKSYHIFELGIDGSLLRPCPQLRHPELMKQFQADEELRLICGYTFLDCARGDKDMSERVIDIFQLKAKIVPVESPTRSKSRCHFLSHIEEGRIKLSVSATKKKSWKYDQDYRRLICSCCNAPIAVLQDSERGVATLKSYLLMTLYKDYHIFAFVCDDCRDVCETAVIEKQSVCLSCFDSFDQTHLVRVPIRYDRRESRGTAIVVTFCSSCFNMPHVSAQLENLRYLEQPILYPL